MARAAGCLIGTSNLDADRPVIWNMGAIASSGRPDRAKLFKEVILASTSIPGVFPPIHFTVTPAARPTRRCMSTAASPPKSS